MVSDNWFILRLDTNVSQVTEDKYQFIILIKFSQVKKLKLDILRNELLGR